MTSPFASPKVDVTCSNDAHTAPFEDPVDDHDQDVMESTEPFRRPSDAQYRKALARKFDKRLETDNSDPSTETSDGEAPIQAVRKSLNPIAASTHSVSSSLAEFSPGFENDPRMSRMDMTNLNLYATGLGMPGSTMSGTMTMIIRTKKLKPVKGEADRFMFIALMLSILMMCTIVLPTGGHGWARSDEPVAQGFLNALNITSLNANGTVSDTIQSSFFFLTNNGPASTEVGLFETCACLRVSKIACPSLVRIFIGAQAMAVASIGLEITIIGFLVYEYSHPNHTVQLPRITTFLVGLLTVLMVLTWGLFRSAALSECGVTFVTGSSINGDIIPTSAVLDLPGKLASIFWLKTFEAVAAFILFLASAMQLTGYIRQTERNHRILTFSTIALMIITCATTTSRGWMTGPFTQMGLWALCSCTSVVEMCTDSSNVFRSGIAFAILSILSNFLLFVITARIFYWKAPPLVIPLLSVLNLMFAVVTFAIFGTWFHQSYCGKIAFSTVGYFYWSFWIWLTAIVLSLAHFIFVTLHYKGFHIPWVHDVEKRPQEKAQLPPIVPGKSYHMTGSTPNPRPSLEIPSINSTPKIREGNLARDYSIYDAKAQAAGSQEDPESSSDPSATTESRKI